MSITVAFSAVVAAVLGGGTLLGRWERSHRLVFDDEAGSGVAARALARFESRQLLGHPTWLITAAFVSLVTGLLIVADGGSETLAHELPWFAFVGIPTAGLALVVSAHRTTTRSRRLGTEELIAATPTAPRARTVAHLASCVVPLAVIAVFVLADLLLVYALYEYAPRPSVDLLLPLVAFVLPIVGGGVVGVLLARWLPVAVAPLLGIAALMWLNNGVDNRHPQYRMLRVAVETSFASPFDIVPHEWHLVFVGALVGLGCCLALWRHGPTRRLLATTVAVVAVVVGTGWSITRPPSVDDVALVVDRLERPADHLSCSERDGVEYCVHPGVEHWIDMWAPAIGGVLEQVPVGRRPGDLRLVQRPVVEPHEFLAEVRAALDPEKVWADDGDLHPNYYLGEDDADLPVAWQAAAAAVGLPPATSWDHPVGCMAGGQARIVLAHLLAARATPTSARSFADHAEWVRAEGRSTAAVPIDIEWDYDADTPQAESQRTPEDAWLGADGVTRRMHVPYAGASGWGTDVLVARALATTERAEVDRVIEEHWEELVDPTTPTSRFVELAGLDGADTADAPAPTSLDDPRACR